MTTMGDRVLNISLPKIGEKALFTKDLEDALKNGRVDFVVHSLKDLPTSLPAGMAIGAILEREDPRDALVLHAQYNGKNLDTLPVDSIIGTSSLRRGAQLARKYPHLKVQDIRGNLNTRLAKLDAPNSKFAGIILAQAGLVRMGWQSRISQTLNAADVLYAVGQGALAVECRSNDTKILNMLQKLNCIHTQCKILTERSFLKTLGGGCSAPVAVISDLKRKLLNSKTDASYDLNITGAVWSLDGSIEVLADDKCNLSLDDDNSNEIIPTKRTKLDETTPSKNPSNPKSNSPTIVDDSKASCSTAPCQYDIESLINIHGEFFKKCPYSSKLLKVDLPAQDPTPFIPVGQDVMGECPYFNVEQKTLAASLIPIPNDETKKQANTTSDSVPPVTGCPFIQSKSTKSDLNKDETDKIALVPEKIETENKLLDNIPLFCGLYRHQCYRLDVFRKCEELGKTLANKLIDNGALKVMESAQTEIRQKI